MPAKQKKSGQRKLGRNEAKCALYRARRGDTSGSKHPIKKGRNGRTPAFMPGCALGGGRS